MTITDNTVYFLLLFDGRRMLRASHSACVLLAVAIIAVSQIFLFRKLQNIVGEDVNINENGIEKSFDGKRWEIQTQADRFKKQRSSPLVQFMYCPRISYNVFVIPGNKHFNSSHNVFGVRDTQWHTACKNIQFCKGSISRILLHNNGTVVESPPIAGVCDGLISKPPVWMEVDMSPAGPSTRTQTHSLLLLTFFQYPLSEVVFAAQQPQVRTVLERQAGLTFALGDSVYQQAQHTFVLPDFELVPCAVRVDDADVVLDVPVWNSETFPAPITSFIPCSASALDIREQHRKKSAALAHLSTFETDVLQILRLTSDAFNSVGVRFWLNSGTLLGLLRECGVIEHSKDADIGVFAEDFADNEKVRELVVVLQGLGLRLSHRFGTLRDSFELSFQSEDTGLKLDIFFFYAYNITGVAPPARHADGHSPVVHTKGWWNGGTQARTGLKFRYDFPAMTLCWASMLGQLDVRIPCNTEAWVAANYGPEWRTPVSVWDWKKSPPNVYPNGAWQQATWPFTIQCDVCMFKINHSSPFDVHFPTTI
eukprot:m.75267 g.75267  ORF g.75267 m.75267 type:complete len:536 (+) comp16166_c0_seq1:206-1813(+)